MDDIWRCTYVGLSEDGGHDIRDTTYSDCRIQGGNGGRELKKETKKCKRSYRIEL